mmetsp:Transcript_11105/g.13877  ORF Transcript_11105/g.13877 Transcript_11105/m.13877 type:complete len:99 (-) Transcript_11105:65-361(-)
MKYWSSNPKCQEINILYIESYMFKKQRCYRAFFLKNETSRRSCCVQNPILRSEVKSPQHTYIHGKGIIISIHNVKAFPVNISKKQCVRPRYDKIIKQV